MVDRTGVVSPKRCMLKSLSYVLTGDPQRDDPPGLCGVIRGMAAFLFDFGSQGTREGLVLEYFPILIQVKVGDMLIDEGIQFETFLAAMIEEIYVLVIPEYRHLSFAEFSVATYSSTVDELLALSWIPGAVVNAREEARQSIVGEYGEAPWSFANATTVAGKVYLILLLALQLLEERERTGVVIPAAREAFFGKTLEVFSDIVACREDV